MALITFPTLPGIASYELTLQAPPSQVVTSDWTGVRKVLAASQGSRFRFSVELAKMKTESVVRDWRTFFAQLRGPVNTFYLPFVQNQNTHASEPQTSAALAKGATTGAFDGMVPSTSYLAAGHFATFPLSSGFHQIVIARNLLLADGAGADSFGFDPPLHGAVADNTVIETQDPYAHVSLVGEAQWSKEPGGIYTVGFECEEVYA